MQASGRIALSLGFTAGLVGGCLNIGAYNCTDSTQCRRGSEPGFCQPTGYCSYADPICATGFRYGDEADAELAGECVEAPGNTDTDTDPTAPQGSTSSSSGDASETVDPTTVDASTTSVTDTDTTGSETGDTCGSLDQPCCDDACDDGLTCYGGTCGCVAEMAAGTNHTCVTRTDGSVLCWGANNTGQLGVPGVLSSAVPVLTAEALLGGEGLRATHIDASAHTCALREDGNAVCWGENATGASTPGLPSLDAAVPTLVNLATNWVQPAVGGGFTCIAQGSEFLATCFGSNNRGQLTGVATPGPVNVEALFNFAEIDAATSHVCGRTATGDMYCWGENANGQLGLNPMTVPFSATVRQILVPPVGDIAVGDAFTCARVSDQVNCWGDNGLGQLGDGMGIDSITAVVALLPASPITDLTAHGNVACAQLGSGEVYCWGDNTGNKLQFVGETKNDLFATTPVLLDLLDEASLPVVIDQVVFGSGHGCVLSDTHELFCWGLNAQGQVGNGIPSAQVLIPTRVAITCE
jgi:alpha-tubulin suppressor-like RCC1 family protein